VLLALERLGLCLVVLPQAVQSRKDPREWGSVTYIAWQTTRRGGFGYWRPFVMTRRSRIAGAVAVGLILAGVAVAAVVASRDTGAVGVTSTTPRSTVDVSAGGDPIVSITFDYVPEGTAPQPFVPTPTTPGERPLTSVLPAIGPSLPAPDQTDATKAGCSGVAVNVALRSGRILRYLSCDRPAPIKAVVRASGVPG
jgi:hypothetical protein